MTWTLYCPILPIQTIQALLTYFQVQKNQPTRNENIILSHEAHKITFHFVGLILCLSMFFILSSYV